MSHESSNHQAELNTGPETKTLQSSEAECNINNIMARYNRPSDLAPIAEHLLQYADMTGIPDMHAALTAVTDARARFAELPADVRDRCGHDVGNFIQLMEDPDFREEAVEFGLIEEPKTTLPTGTGTESNPVPTPPEIPATPPIIEGE